MKQTLTQRIEELEKTAKLLMSLVMEEDIKCGFMKPYTAMRSTGELTKEELDEMKIEYEDFLNKKYLKPLEEDNLVHPSACDCRLCNPQKDRCFCECHSLENFGWDQMTKECGHCNKHKPQEYVKKRAARCIWRDEDWHGSHEGAERIVNMILAIVKGE